MSRVKSTCTDRWRGRTCRQRVRNGGEWWCDACLAGAEHEIADEQRELAARIPLGDHVLPLPARAR